MLERERQRTKEAGGKMTTGVLVDMLRTAICLPSDPLKEIALRQAKRMALNLKKQYRYLGALKNTVLDTLAGINNISLAQRQEIIAWMEQFVT